MPSILSRRILLLLVVATPFAAVFAGCERGDSPSAEDVAVLQMLELTSSDLPASPTNRFADSPEAAALGRRLFFDRGLSENGTVACVDCHDPSQGFSDDREHSLGTQGLPGGRHTMPVTTAALQPFLLWDGRADSAWRQPLYAIENPVEMDASRLQVAHYVAATYRGEYEAAFGLLPSLEGLPPRGRPDEPAWAAMAPEEQDAVHRVFVNVGKAIEAYERLLVCGDTRFDQWARGEAEMSDDELEGAARFVEDGCTGCHDGPAVSDGKFHNLGLSRDDASSLDVGREEGLAILLADPLNGAGKYSDDPNAGLARLAIATAETDTRGAFRTASLRGVGQRPRFGHLGEHTNLEEFIEDVYRRRGGRRGDGDGNRNGGEGDGDGGDFIGELDPLFQEVDLEGGDERTIAAFLRTMDCAAPAEDLLAP